MQKPLGQKSQRFSIYIYMDQRPTVYKKVSSTDTIFFVFEIGASKFVLYDSGLGDPIQYGSQRLILGELDKQIKDAQNRSRNTFKVYWMVRDAVKGWKESGQRPKGYSANGIVDKFQKPNVNSSNIKTPKLKKISLKEKQFYWFEYNAGQHVVYDSDMGSPVSYGNSGFVNKTFNNIDKYVRDGVQSKYVLWYFKRSGDNGMWEHKQPPRIPNWKVESTDKKDLDNEKKGEKEEDRK
jgi:hypothetical protein